MKALFQIAILILPLFSFSQEEIILEMNSEGLHEEENVEEKIVPTQEKYEFGILDSLKPTLDKLVPELDAAIVFYSEKYPDEEINLKAVTTYEYASKGNFIEKSISRENAYTNYSIQHFQNEKSIRLLYLFMNNVSLQTKKYDKNGILVEKGEFRSDSKNIEKYRNESSKSELGDTIITKFFTNERLSQITKTLNTSENCTEIWHLYTNNELNMKSKFCYSDKKHLYSEFENFSYPYHTQEESFYYSNGLIMCKLEKKLHNKVTVETDSHYNIKKQLIKEEEFTDGQISFTRTYDYDKNGNIILEKGIGQSGKLRYQCIYEYDAQNRKTLYLYYYML
jgi:hypothetical protein